MPESFLYDRIKIRKSKKGLRNLVEIKILNIVLMLLAFILLLSNRFNVIEFFYDIHKCFLLIVHGE